MTSIDDLLDKAVELREDDQYDDSLSILEELFLHNPIEKVKQSLIETLFMAGGFYNDIYELEYEKAIQNFNRIIDLDPKSYRAHYNLGIAYSNLGKIDIALKSYKKAIKIKPDYKHCYYNIGLIFEEKGDYRKALKYYEKSLEIDPDFTYAVQAIHQIRKIMDSQKGVKRAT